MKTHTMNTLTPFRPMEFSITYDTVKSEWSSICILRDHRLYFPKILFFFHLRSYSVDPGEMPYNATFDHGIHCLPKYPFRSFRG